MNCGNTDAWCKVVRLLCEPGDFILCEQYTYPSAQALWIPMGCTAAPVKIDSRGLIPSDLESILGSWEELHPGTKRPHLYASLLSLRVRVLRTNLKSGSILCLLARIPLVLQWMARGGKRFMIFASSTVCSIFI